MKRLTLLTMLVTLLSVTAFAQKGTKMLPLEGALSAPSTLFQGLARQAQSVTTVSRRADELVTPPSSATLETWYTVGGIFRVYSSSGWVDCTVDMKSVNVIIDGSDIYVQGLAYWFKGWIKGTISESKVTFASGQFVGEDSYGPEYICGSDDGQTLSENIEFGYDATEGILTAVTPFILENSSLTSLSPYCYWSSPVFSKTATEMPNVVVAPEGLQTDEWTINAVKNNGDAVSGYVNIGFDGNDVYLQGLCTYLPEAWIKGTLDGTTITFAGDQYFGYYDNGPSSSYDFFLCPDGVAFAYDAEAGKLTATGEIYIYTGGSNLKGDVYNNPVITKVVEKAGTPTTPVITEIYDSSYGPIAMFTIPTLDVDGNAMASSKLSFQFFKDIEKVIDAVTFEPADYKKLTETMTVIPYGFTEDYDFYPTYIYMNQTDFSQWNKIGIQAIYTGGGEEHKSEIFWLDLQPYSKVSFNFNAMTDEPCSSNDSNAGDITADRTFEANGVTLTVSPNPEGTANRFWNTNQGPQLRVYGGTLTFEVPMGKVITKMVFNNGKWNNKNSADTGAFDGNVWTGEAQKVVVTIAGNTQLNSIDVYPTDFIPTAVEAPEGLVTETYVFKATAVEATSDPADAVEQPYSLQVKVGFDGNDAYIQGLASDAPELWVKATKNAAGQYVIPANQFMGVLSFWGGMFTFDYYFTAVDAEGKMVDAVFDYDAEKSLFTTSQTLMLNEGQTELNPYITFTNVTIEKFIEVAATPADPTLQVINFANTSYPSIYCSLATGGTNGEELNLDKLFYTVWIEKDGVQQPYTFTAVAYNQDFAEDVTEVPYTHNGYDLYAGGEIIYFEETLEEIGTWSKVGIQTIYYGAGEVHKSNIVWMTNDAFIPTEITVSKSGFATFYDAYHNFVIPEGVRAYVVTAATTDKLTYDELKDVIPAGTAVMLEAEAGTYPIVVSFEKTAYDGINLLHGSNVAAMTTANEEDCLFYKLAYGHSGTANANKLGWYWGAENGAAFEIEAHRAWLAIPHVVASAPGYPFGGNVTGISTTLAVDSADCDYYDLQGRRIGTPVKGLYIQKNKKVIIK